MDQENKKHTLGNKVGKFNIYLILMYDFQKGVIITGNTYNVKSEGCQTRRLRLQIGEFITWF